MHRAFLPLILALGLAWSSPSGSEPRSGPAPSLAGEALPDFEILMHTHGRVSFAPYLHGEGRGPGPEPGYRSEFLLHVDFFRFKDLISTWQISHTTTIERSDSSFFRLNTIRYTLTPGYRYERGALAFRGQLTHECIHTISREEEKGAVWWNALEAGFGTLGGMQSGTLAAFRYPRPPWGRTDFQQSFLAFLPGRDGKEGRRGEGRWLGQNHGYRFAESGLLRFALLNRERAGLFTELHHQNWWSREGRLSSRVGLGLHFLLKGRHNPASLFYTWNLFDTSPHDNQKGLGALGLGILF